jgi:hypothetical protein
VQRAIYLKMCEGLICVKLVLAQPFQDNRIGTFSIKLDFATGCSNEGRHPFTRRVELANVQDLEFL